MPDPVRPDRAQGVFETLLIIDGLPIELDAHLQRLSRSVHDLFGEQLPPGARRLVLDRAGAVALGRLRLTVAPRGAGGLLAADAVSAAVDPEDLFPSWERAIALRPLLLAGGLGSHKWADRARLTLAGGETDDELPLVLDAGGEVLEASRANVFAVDGDALITPPADGRILAGVARARAIDAARALEIELCEQALPLDRLIAAGAAFLTGSLRGLEPVRSVGGAELAPPGEAVAKLAGELRRMWIGDGAVRPVPAR